MGDWAWKVSVLNCCVMILGEFLGNFVSILENFVLGKDISIRNLVWVITCIWRFVTKEIWRYRHRKVVTGEVLVTCVCSRDKLTPVILKIFVIWTPKKQALISKHLNSTGEVLVTCVCSSYKLTPVPLYWRYSSSEHQKNKLWLVNISSQGMWLCEIIWNRI